MLRIADDYDACGTIGFKYTDETFYECFILYAH